MRYAKYIALLVAFFAVSACTIADIDENINVGTQHNSADNIQVIGRISRYSEYDVATRGAKTTEEGKVTSMALAIFKIGDKAATAVGTCEYFNYQEGGELLFTIDRKDKYTSDAHYAMYVFANIADMEKFEAKIEERTIINDEGEEEIVYDYSAIILDDLKSVASEVSDIKVPESGFPMIGSLGDFVSEDGDRTMQGNPQYFILKPAGQPTPLPTVNDQAKDLLTIPMKAMYAKMNFSIIVTPDQTIEDKLPPQFQITGYEVYNVPSEVDFKKDTNSDTDVLGEPCVGVLLGVNDVAVGAGTIDFSFYVPERYFEPKTKSENYDYPFKGTYSDIADKDGNGISDEDEKYMQRYKPMLVGDKKATYVRISGIYLDHQNKQFQVSYDIYLGKDNYSNFDVERNSEYNNYITIRGISTSADQTDNAETISIDHRVNVTRLTPLTINLRRETLLDSHFEVRPLRIRKTKNYQSDVEGAIPVPTSVKVKVIYPKDEPTDWVGLELANSAISTAHLSSGKRKYFTTDLVTSTLKATTAAGIEVPINDEQQTVWIYVDENTTTQSRAAIVRVSYGGVNNDYKIVQQGLYEVKGRDSGKTYYIEQYEEYLYNYDAEDSYGQTNDEGMQWGLDGVPLSNEHDSYKCDETNSYWTDWVNKNSKILTYDFYTEKHDLNLEKEGAYIHKRAEMNEELGQHFTKDIVKKSNNGVSNLTMDQQPSGAVEYCYNRNKRDANGNVEKVEWYLPSADELEDFIVTAYSSFKEFQDNYYWTSQPAYIRNIFYYEYRNWALFGEGSVQDAYSFKVYEDNTKYARATKVVYRNGDFAYALSGLNDKPNDPSNYESLPSNKEKELGYFHTWHAWKKPKSGDGVYSSTTDNQVYDEYRDRSKTGNRYYAYLNHLDDMIQEGYHPRTKYNRVRCVRVKPTN